MHDKNFLEKYRVVLSPQLHQILLSKMQNSQEKAESISHALYDISESIENIYLIQIPKILFGDLSKSEIEGIVFEIKSEFDHILYHINDAELFNIKPVSE